MQGYIGNVGVAEYQINKNQHQIETGAYVESCTDNEPLLLDSLHNDGIEYLSSKPRHDAQALVLRSRLWGLRFKAWDL